MSIPAIGVQSELITLGLNPDGTLAVPEPGPDYDKAAWFDGSPRPGDIGPAVIEGHVDSAANGPSVFYRLGELAVGDRVDVTRADGSVVTFEVYEVRVVPKDDFPTLDVYGNTDGPGAAADHLRRPVRQRGTQLRRQRRRLRAPGPLTLGRNGTGPRRRRRQRGPVAYLGSRGKRPRGGSEEVLASTHSAPGRAEEHEDEADDEQDDADRRQDADLRRAGR